MYTDLEIPRNQKTRTAADAQKYAEDQLPKQYKWLLKATAPTKSGWAFKFERVVEGMPYTYYKGNPPK